MSQESRKDLKKCIDHLMMLEDQDQTEKDWRAVYECRSAELANSRLIKNQLREALSTKVNEIKLIKQSAVENVEKLRAKIITLKTNLKDQMTREDALRASIARLEEARQLDVVCQNNSASNLRMSRSLDSDQSSRNRNECMDSQDWDHGKDESIELLNLSESDNFESSSSIVDD